MNQVPGFSEDFAVLASKEQIFGGLEPARAWAQAYITEVFKEPKVVSELLANLASGDPAENGEGMKSLRRGILAQVAWVQGYKLWSDNRHHNQLKEVTGLIRDHQATEEEHREACESFVRTSTELAKQVLIRELLRLIKDAEFMAWATNRFEPWMREDLNKNGTSLEDWMKYPDSGISKILAELSRIKENRDFEPDSKPVAKKGKKGGRSAEKRAADRQATLAARALGTRGKG